MQRVERMTTYERLRSRLGWRCVLGCVCFLSLERPGLTEELRDVFATPRPLGMGGAFTAVANDENALWTNPAGIAYTRKPRARQKVHVVTFPQALVEVNGNAEAFSSALENANGLDESLARLAGNPLVIRFATAPTVIFEAGRNLPASLALFGNVRAELEVDRFNTSQTRARSVSDVGSVFGLAWTGSLADNRFSFGVQLRPTLRYAFEDNLDSTSLVGSNGDRYSTVKDKFFAKGKRSFGMGIDMGFLWTLADFWFPTLGVSVFNLPTGCKSDFLSPYTETRENICGNKFSGDLASEDALSALDPTDVRVGFSILPRFSRKFALRVAVDAHHLPVTDGQNNYGFSGVELQKLLHAGVELVLGNPLALQGFSLRAGSGQGFLSYGLSFQAWIFAFELASYSKDISASKSPEGDRRLVLGLSAEF